VLRVQSRGTDAPVELGHGMLIDQLAVGRHFRVVIDGQPTLSTSAVQRLQSRADGSIEIETANSVYLLESEAPGAGVEAEKSIADTTRRLNRLVLRGRFTTAALPGAAAVGECPACGMHDSTRSVSLAAAPKPGAGPFHSGVAIRVTRIRARDRPGGEVGDLGSGVLLDDLTMGEPARFSLSQGPTIATSPVRGLETLSGRSVQLVTRNSIYRFELTGATLGTSGLPAGPASGEAPGEQPRGKRSRH
jgi:hypothetical protein